MTRVWLLLLLLLGFYQPPTRAGNYGEDAFKMGDVGQPSDHKYRDCAHVPLPRTPVSKPNPRWLKSQVQFWYGDLYSFAVRGRWDVVHATLMTSQYGKVVGGMLSKDDTTAAKVRAKYKEFGAYRHWHNAYILCDMLQHAPEWKNFTEAHRFPILMVDMVGPLEAVIASRRSINPGHELALIWPWPHHLLNARKGLKDNRPFSSKKGKIVFRGALAGPLRHMPNAHYGKLKTSRLDLISTWANASWADMGIAEIPRDRLPAIEEDEDMAARVRAVSKPVMPLSQLMQHKYVLCVEGEDISTGFGWVLASNSVPFHPYPFLHQVWYFNGLQPWVHFVPLLPDGSDLQDVYLWCESNPQECEGIATAGRKHMSDMLNIDYITAVKSAVVGLWDLQEP